MMACASSEGEDQASSKTASAKAVVKLGRAKAAAVKAHEVGDAAKAVEVKVGAAAGSSPAMFCASTSEHSGWRLQKTMIVFPRPGRDYFGICR